MTVLRNSIRVSFFLFLFLPAFAGAMNVNEIIKLNLDASGYLNFTYWEKGSIVDKNPMVGNFPFTKDKADQLFNTANLKLQTFEVGKYEKDNSYTEIKARIFFKNITKLSELKALSGIVVSYYKSDTGQVFVYEVPSGYAKSNSIENLYVILNPDANIHSASGKINGKSIEWFRSSEYLNANKNIYFVATLNVPAKNEPKSTGNEVDKNGKKESCGLFGIELPLILLGGLVISRKFRSKS